jgi:hypothetical protein
MTARPSAADMNRIFLLCLSLAAQGCLVSRTLVLGDPLPSLQAPHVAASWKVGEVVAHATSENANQSALRDFAPLKAQLEEHVRKTLEGQVALGTLSPTADYEVDVRLEVDERSGLSPWFGLGLGMEAGILVAGASVGTAIAGPAGTLTGMLVAAPVAVLAAMTPPNSSERGEVGAELTIRRRARPEVAKRHVRHIWKRELNGFFKKQRLAEESGAAVMDLERAVLTNVRDMLLELQPEARPPAIPSPQRSLGLSGSTRIRLFHRASEPGITLAHVARRRHS